MYVSVDPPAFPTADVSWSHSIGRWRSGLHQDAAWLIRYFSRGRASIWYTYRAQGAHVRLQLADLKFALYLKKLHFLHHPFCLRYGVLNSLPRIFQEGWICPGEFMRKIFSSKCMFSSQAVGYTSVLTAI